MAESRPNMLFIMSDQHSFRHLGHQGHTGKDEAGEPVQTPTLDGLANSATRFENAYAAAPLCTPSRLCMLSGREQANAGAWGNSAVLPPEIQTLPGTLSEAGYTTCLLGKMHLGGNRQFAGFDRRPYGDLTGRTGHQGEPPNPLKGIPTDWKALLTDVGVTNLPESLLQEQTIVQESLAFLREHRHHNPDQPWFMCASFSRPHWPRTAPSRHIERYWPDNVPEPKVVEESATYDHPATEFLAELTKARDISEAERQRARAAYFACVDYLDEILGEYLALLERDGFLDNTIIVYVSDHGELGGEHGLWDKMTWHEASCRVPMLIQLPEQRDGSMPGRHVETPVSLIDLYPTSCGLADVDYPDELDGIDLSNSIREQVDPPARPIFVDGFFLGRMGGAGTSGADYEYRMVRDGSMKYVQFRNAPELLFDLSTDPFETRNLVADPRPGVEQTLEELRTIVASTIDFEDISTRRAEDNKLREEYKLGTARGDPNQYHFPDGRVINADSAIYNPHVICEHPEVIYDDYSPPEQG